MNDPSTPRRAFLGAEVFDGDRRHNAHALLVEGDRVVGVIPEHTVPADAQTHAFDGGLICPGFVDLQVNGGGGVMFNDAPSADTLFTMAEAHARLGATSILPTLITDTVDKTRAAIDAVGAAISGGIPGIIGLHLEGPHLAVARKGAHDPHLIRPMTDADLRMLLEAAARLPVLMVTLAPESVTPAQIEALHAAGVTVSLGHSDAGLDTCAAAARAGATCVTHLFNAMSPLGNREPGLVGAALTLGGLSAGLIADGIHVHPQSIRAAYHAKTGPGRIFLVSDAMAVAGSDQGSFTLNARRVTRSGGRLTLDDGTLAGADLDLVTAVRNMINWGIVAPDTALAMASAIPAGLVSARGGLGVLSTGSTADFLHFPSLMDGHFEVWRAAQRLDRIAAAKR